MALKGLARQGRNVAVAMASVGVALGVIAPVAAAQETQTWEMPGLRRELLQRAVDSVTAAAGAGNVKFNLYDREYNQVIYNFTNWIVCGQAPAAGKVVKVNPEKPQTVTFALSRPSAGC